MAIAWATKINDAIAGSIVGRRFRLEGSGHRRERNGSRFLTELRAGIATFFAMAYIISVCSLLNLSNQEYNRSIDL